MASQEYFMRTKGDYNELINLAARIKELTSCEVVFSEIVSRKEMCTILTVTPECLEKIIEAGIIKADDILEPEDFWS